MKNAVTAELIHGIETQCFTEPWSIEMVKSHMNTRHSVTLIKTANAVPVGYAAGIRLGDEAELYRIAVLPAYRGQGYAKELLMNFVSKCEGDIFLEVRSKNTAAIGLYESTGFILTGRRINYYGDDDALIYSSLTSK